MATWNVFRENDLIDQVEFVDSANEIFVLNTLRKNTAKYYGKLTVLREGGNTVTNRPGLTFTASRIGMLDAPNDGKDEFLKVETSIPVSIEDVFVYYKYTEYGSYGISNCLNRRVMRIDGRDREFVMVLEHRNR